MLVAGTGSGEAALVRTKDLGQQTRLIEHALCAAIEVCLALQRGLEQFLESGNPLPLPSKLVVEPEHVHHESGSEVDRGLQVQRRSRLAGGRLGDGFALVGR